MPRAMSIKCCLAAVLLATSTGCLTFSDRAFQPVTREIARQTIEAVSVMVMQRGELVLIHVDGELEEMIEFALRPARGSRGGFSFS